jgi:hypothetical protein
MHIFLSAVYVSIFPPNRVYFYFVYTTNIPFLLRYVLHFCRAASLSENSLMHNLNHEFRIQLLAESQTSPQNGRSAVAVVAKERIATGVVESCN